MRLYPSAKNGRHLRTARAFAVLAATATLTPVVWATSASAHTVSGDYNFGFCYGSYWSEPVSGHVEAGMNDHYLSTALGECQASEVRVRMKEADGTWITATDYDSLMPLGVEVDEYYLYVSYSDHRSKEDDGTWHYLRVNH